MADHHDELSAALEDAERARKFVAKLRGRQVRSREHQDFLKATALSWFRSRRPVLVDIVPEDGLVDIDSAFRIVLDAAERNSAKTTFASALLNARTALVAARGRTLTVAAPTHSADSAPNFGTLASDPTMQAILQRRWNECALCLHANAVLAATVMMGGLLEALFVARANRLSDKAVLFKCATTPLDSKTKKPLDLRHWTLAPYIDVGHELRWISKSAKDVAAILRDYRNYVHPEKERSHGVVLAPDDAQMFWELTKTLSRQLLALSGVT